MSRSLLVIVLLIAVAAFGGAMLSRRSDSGASIATEKPVAASASRITNPHDPLFFNCAPSRACSEFKKVFLEQADGRAPANLIAQQIGFDIGLMRPDGSGGGPYDAVATIILRDGTVLESIREHGEESQAAAAAAHRAVESAYYAPAVR